jgi:hypothetical protein
VLLVQVLQRLLVALDSRFFRRVLSRPVNVGGYACFLVTADRTGEEWTEGGEKDTEEESSDAKRARIT